MELTLDRFSKTDFDTLGKLSIDGNYECYILENPHHDQKIKGHTCIPAGRYQILLRHDGTHDTEYKVKFPGIHKGMLWVQDVPNFQYILMHIGNFVKDTKGCLICGTNYSENPGLVSSQTGTSEHERQVNHSTAAYLHYYPKVAAALEAGEDVFITITD